MAGFSRGGFWDAGQIGGKGEKKEWGSIRNITGMWTRKKMR